MPNTPRYTGVSLTIEAKDALQRLSAHLSGVEGRRVSLSEAVLIAERVVRAAPTE